MGDITDDVSSSESFDDEIVPSSPLTEDDQSSCPHRGSVHHISYRGTHVMARGIYVLIVSNYCDDVKENVEDMDHKSDVEKDFGDRYRNIE